MCMKFKLIRAKYNASPLYFACEFVFTHMQICVKPHHSLLAQRWSAGLGLTLSGEFESHFDNFFSPHNQFFKGN